MASTFTTSLGTVTFIADTTSWGEPADSEVNVIGFPGGDAIAISIAGQRDTRRTFTAVFDNVADYRLFSSMRAKAGYLRVDNWDNMSRSAVLVRTAPNPPYMSGELSCQANFILY